MFEFWDNEGEGEQLWCLRGYPFECLLWEVIHFVGMDDPDLLVALDEICRSCPERLEYERHNRGFTV